MELDATDRSASVGCLGLVTLILTIAPLLGVAEDRFHVTTYPSQLRGVGGQYRLTSGPTALSTPSSPTPATTHESSRPTVRPSSSGSIKSDSSPTTAAGPSVDLKGNGISPAPASSFVCMDFVCVNRSTARASVLSSSAPATTAMPHFTTFASCVANCVVSGGAASSTAPTRAAATTTATAPNRAATAPTAAGPGSSAELVLATKRIAGLVRVGNQSLERSLESWIAARHDAGAACTPTTPVYFAPFSPNGIGNKLMAVVMAFHMALMTGRRLVVSDWPPRTLATRYPLAELLQPSSCQALFDDDRNRPQVKKCTIVSCPLHTASVFGNSYTQPHWAHMSPQFLDLPADWQHLDWLTWWRALTQYLLRPGPKLMEGLASTLGSVAILQSPASPRGGRASGQQLHRATAGERAAASSKDVVGFARRFAGGVATWTSQVKRPLIGVHVRLGDGCWDSKRGGCKYVRSFETILTRLKEAGLTSGTIFLATDNSTIARQATAQSAGGFDVLALGEDRRRVEKSHAQGERRAEPDEMLHLQLLDLALLSQSDILAGVFGSTFVKTALQLGRAATYASLDTFPWCPLLRCYWGWRDMCHNCELCYNSGGGGEACNNNGYHTAGGLAGAVRDRRPARGAFRRFISTVERDFQCRHFSEHPLPPTEYDRPVVGAHYVQAAAVGSAAEVCRQPTGSPVGAVTTGQPPPTSPESCRCGFRRFRGVDNAASAQAKPAYGYGHGQVPSGLLQRAQVAVGGGRGGPVTLEACERACCDDPLCHSVTWRSNTSTCIAAFAIAYGARRHDWCWHPTASEHAITSIRLPGAWEATAQEEARKYLSASSLLVSSGSRGSRGSSEAGVGPGPHALRKQFSTPVGHSHPMERTVEPASCAAPHLTPMSAWMSAYRVSPSAAAAVPFASQLPQCPLESVITWSKQKTGRAERRGGRNRRRFG